MGDELLFVCVIFVNNILNILREQIEHLIQASKKARFPGKKD